jgi:hypothetical protein
VLIARTASDAAKGEPQAKPELGKWSELPRPNFPNSPAQGQEPQETRLELESRVARLSVARLLSLTSRHVQSRSCDFEVADVFCHAQELMAAWSFLHHAGRRRCLLHLARHASSRTQLCRLSSDICFDWSSTDWIGSRETPYIIADSQSIGLAEVTSKIDFSYSQDRK